MIHSIGGHWQKARHQQFRVTMNHTQIMPENGARMLNLTHNSNDGLPQAQAPAISPKAAASLAQKMTGNDISKFQASPYLQPQLPGPGKKGEKFQTLVPGKPMPASAQSPGLESHQRQLLQNRAMHRDSAPNASMKNTGNTIMLPQLKQELAYADDAQLPQIGPGQSGQGQHHRQLSGSNGGASLAKAKHKGLQHPSQASNLSVRVRGQASPEESKIGSQTDPQVYAFGGKQVDRSGLAEYIDARNDTSGFQAKNSLASQQSSAESEAR